MSAQPLPLDSLRLNLGCGHDLKPGFVNVDTWCGDQRHDLNVKPWPWADNAIAEILLHNVLEHLPDTVSVMKEIYRVCHDGGLVHIAVPHPRHDDFINDPTHCSPITIGMMQSFSKRNNRATAKDANNPLALIHNVDFEMDRECFVIEKRWMARVESREITEKDLRDAILTCNNVVKQIEMTLRVVKRRA